MPLDLTERLVVGVASSAVFDTAESGAVFGAEGEESYRAHQRALLDEPLAPGVAFPFVRRLLRLNALRPEDPLVEVVLLSRNDPDTGRRALRSAAHYGLAITRAAFLSGEPPTRYLAAFDCELFLSANEADVRAAIAAAAPAGLVLTPPDDQRARLAPGREAEEDEDDDGALRIAFDFDGVLADDATERLYKERGLAAFRAHEAEHRAAPLNPGPLKRFLERIAAIQTLERGIQSESRFNRSRADPSDTAPHPPRLRTALITARGAPAHERVATTLDAWGVRLDEVFFLGGVEKTAVLRAFRPHLYFDDQRVHLDRALGAAPAAHIPFGVANLAEDAGRSETPD